MNPQEIDQLAAIVRATPILPSATVEFQMDGRTHRLGVAGPKIIERLEAITRGFVRSGVPFSVKHGKAA